MSYQTTETTLGLMTRISILESDIQIKDKRIDELEAELENTRTQSQCEALQEFAKWILEACFQGADICGGDAQDKAFELGLLHREIYNPEVHVLCAGSECEEGDYIYFHNEEFLPPKEQGQ
jgi:hypothetical protein